MALEHGEIQALKKEIFEEADEKYVRVDDCNDRQENINKKFANDDKRIDILITKTSLWEKLLWAIASASIGALVVSVLELILK